MEFPQHRALGTESNNKGRKATHDFLSLYSASSDQQDPTPSRGNYLKTHDFLQPLERVAKNTTTKEQAIEKPAQLLKPHSSIELIRPCGMGTYGISYPNQRPSDHGTLFLAQTTGDTVRTNDSNSGSYLGSTFTIWQESADTKKGKTRKENVASARHDLRGLNWPSSDRKHNASTFRPVSPSQPSSSQNFIDMVTSAKNDQDEELVIKKEPTSQSKGDTYMKVEAKTLDQKPNTPRSKHSATEQRRRSKINDRFQKLREIIPNSDQKRDKASFLFEVIEYIQFLQEKVNRYEGAYNAWNNETSKVMQWSNGHNTKGFTDRARGLNTVANPASAYVNTKFEDNGKNSVDSNNNTSLTTSKEKDDQPQAHAFSFGRTNISTSSVSTKQTSDTDKTTTWPLSHFHQQDLTVESGTINVSSVYSRGLLNTLTKALQSSGVDLSQARISVQIDLGKRLKDGDVTNLSHTNGASEEEDFGQALKRLKTSSSN